LATAKVVRASFRSCRQSSTGERPVLDYTARISFSLWERTVSISLIYSSVLFWISFSACLRSSSVITPSFCSFLARSCA